MQEVTFLLLYKLNEKSITEKYCVNKNEKNSCCKGKCHLNKMITKSENESRNPFSVLNLKVKETEIFVSTLQKIQEVTTSFQFISGIHHIYIARLADGFFCSLIKPPAISV